MRVRVVRMLELAVVVVLNLRVLRLLVPLVLLLLPGIHWHTVVHVGRSGHVTGTPANSDADSSSSSTSRTRDTGKPQRYK